MIIKIMIVQSVFTTSLYAYITILLVGTSKCVCNSREFFFVGDSKLFCYKHEFVVCMFRVFVLYCIYLSSRP